MKSFPDLSYEKSLWKNSFFVIGIDEVGRGAFAGPLVVGGVIFDSSLENQLLDLGINDSKKISEKKREKLAPIIKKLSLFWSVEYIPVDMIDEMGIGKANLLAMKKTYLKAKNKFSDKLFAIVDSFQIPELEHQKAIIRGDSLSITIAAASIVAKVDRDEHMRNLSLKFQVYKWDKNKGYGTREHREAIKKYGVVEHHRRDFVRNHL